MLAVLLGGCGGPRRLTVGSKNFTEQLVLGEIIAQHVERRLSTKVNRTLNLGGTLLSHQALLNGQIDLYPEYSGTALTEILKQKADTTDAGIVLERVRNEYRNLRLEWLEPLGFNNPFAMVVRGEDARAHNWQTLSDAEAFADGFTLGAGYEFQQRPDGYSNLTRTYKIRWRAAPKSMDLGLLYKALQEKQVSMVAGNATDGVLSKIDAKILRDDRGAFPPYYAAIVVRTEALEQFPGLRKALDELSGKFSEDTVRKLNHAVDTEGRQLRDVATEFLKQLP
jgi:glycine betaine/choline ABC-type transport system substrate-binding protein